MQVGKNTVVSLQVEMQDAQSVVLQASDETMTYLHGGYGGMLEALERALEGMQAGAEVRLQLEPEQAFGDYDAGLLRVEPLERYGDGLAVGMQVEEDGTIFTVTDVAGGKAVLDANHPLAGIALRFFVKVLSIRPATEDEVRQGVSLP